MPPSQLTVPDNLTLTSNSTNLLTLKGTATPPAAVIYAPSTAVADGDLSANTLAPSIDETNAALRIRVEYANGTTLKTALRAVPTRVGTASYNTTAGFWAGNNAFLYAQSGTAKNNATGYASWWNSLIVALSTNANNSGNTANYAPATSGTVGNIEALIQWS